MLRSTTAFSGLLDERGNPIPVAAKVDIRDLPEINRCDFPDLPADMELRLLAPASGEAPSIVLFHPGSEMHIEVSLTEMDGIGGYVAKVRVAVERFAMGLPPDGE